jgi:hypothetical protein
VAIHLVPGAMVLLHAWKALPRRVAAAHLLRAAAPACACVGAYLLYNSAQGAGAIVGPYAQYDTAYRLGGEVTGAAAGWALRNNLGGRLARLTVWIPMSVPFLVAMLVRREQRRDVRLWLLFGSFASLLLAYFIYFQDPGNEYGPRYLFESSGAILLLMGLAMHRWGRAGVVLAIAVVLANLAVLGVMTKSFAVQVRERTDLYDTVRRAHVSNAVVFLRTGSGSMPRGDLTRNGISFSGDVLYVLDLGVENRQLLETLPGRKAFTYTYDPSLRRGFLERY